MILSYTKIKKYITPLKKKGVILHKPETRESLRNRKQKEKEPQGKPQW